MKIINGEGLMMGRICSVAAKMALLGEEVKIVNCEKIVISGDPTFISHKEKDRRSRKAYPLKSAKFSRLPDRYVRRTVRGMLPYKSPRGKDAFKRIMCYVGVPPEFSGASEIIKNANKEKLLIMKYTTVGEVCDWLKGK